MIEAVEQLNQILKDDLQWHKDLAVILDSKLQAMRGHDLRRLETLVESEQRLTGLICANEARRRSVIVIASERCFPQGRKKIATAGELADVLEDRANALGTEGAILRSKAEQLRILTAMLRQETQNVRRLNQVNRIATEKITGHLQGLFRIIAESGCDIGLYGSGGKKTYLEHHRLVDAQA